MAIAWSATVSSLAPGVVVMATPSSVAAPMSIESMPTPTLRDHLQVGAVAEDLRV